VKKKKKKKHNSKKIKTGQFRTKLGSQSPALLHYNS
jgi:hypothetical protein